jgi:1-acyl-sn-glycerol-3-phosphate acyltransferase
MKDKKILYCSPTFQNLIRKTLKLVFNNYFNVNVHGKENIPKKGSLIFSCNHTNNLDPLILAGQTKRINYAMSKKELFFPGLKNILVKLGAYPVETKPTKKGYKDLTENYGLLIPKRNHDNFLKEINQYLSKEDKLDNLSTLDHKLFTEYILNTEGGLIMFLPGTRFKSYDKIEYPKKGAAWNAFEMYEKYKTIVNIIPSSMVYSLDKKPFIAETYAMKYKTDVDIILGKPITIENHFDAYKTNKKEAVTKLTDIINREVNSQTNLILMK